MTDRTRKNNNKLWITLGIIIFILTILGSLVGFDHWVEGKIENNKAVVQLQSDLEWSRENIKKDFDNLKEQMDRIEKKLDKLLANEYGP